MKTNQFLAQTFSSRLHTSCESPLLLAIHEKRKKPIYAGLLGKFRSLFITLSCVALVGMTARAHGEAATILISRLDDIPASQNQVVCTLLCHDATPGAYLSILTNLGLGIRAQQGGSNSVVISGTGCDVRSAAAAMLALNMAGNIESKTIQMFPLKYADAQDVATMVNDLFAPGRAGSDRSPARATVAPKWRESVYATADARTDSLLVTAPQDLIAAVRELVQKIDQPVEDLTEVKLFQLKNADCTMIASLLTDLYSSRANTNGATAPQRGNPSTSERQGGRETVVAVPDPRTKSILINASKEVMPQIEEMITNLDSIQTALPNPKQSP